MSDLDPEDSAETPFAREAGKQEGRRLRRGRGRGRARLGPLEEGGRDLVEEPCIDAKAVDQCPAGGNCVRLEQARRSPDDDETDGEFEGNEDDGDAFRTGGPITVFTKLMDEESDNGALATIVHELGHVDFDNLLVLYGTRP